MAIKILGLKLDNRTVEAGSVQKVLTKYGCSIRTRLGLHEVTVDACATNGLIILELCGDKKEWAKLEGELEKLTGVTVKSMSFK